MHLQETKKDSLSTRVSRLLSATPTPPSGPVRRRYLSVDSKLDWNIVLSLYIKSNEGSLVHVKDSLSAVFSHTKRNDSRQFLSTTFPSELPLMNKVAHLLFPFPIPLFGSPGFHGQFLNREFSHDVPSFHRKWPPDVHWRPIKMASVLGGVSFKPSPAINVFSAAESMVTSSERYFLQFCSAACLLVELWLSR